MLGIFGTLPAVIALVIGTLLALTVWRVRLIQILLVATVLLFGAVALEVVISTRWTDIITTIIAAGYGLLVIGVAVRSLTGFGIVATFTIVVAVVGCFIFGATTGNLLLMIAGLLIVPAATIIRYLRDHPNT